MSQFFAFTVSACGVDPCPLYNGIRCHKIQPGGPFIYIQLSLRPGYIEVVSFSMKELVSKISLTW